MAVENLLKCVLHGSGVGEEFAWGINVQCASAPDSEADLTSIMGEWNTLMGSLTTPSPWTNLQGLISDDQAYDTLSGYFYPVDTGPALYIAHHAVTKTGTSPQYGMLQQAAVATLTTGRNGASYRGRAYLPHTGQYPGANHLLSAAQVLAVSTAWSGAALALSQACRDSSTGDGSRVGVYSPTLHVINEITGLSVDNRLDVQRRRAEDQVSARTSYGFDQAP